MILIFCAAFSTSFNIDKALPRVISPSKLLSLQARTEIPKHWDVAVDNLIFHLFRRKVNSLIFNANNCSQPRIKKVEIKTRSKKKRNNRSFWLAAVLAVSNERVLAFTTWNFISEQFKMISDTAAFGSSLLHAIAIVVVVAISEVGFKWKTKGRKESTQCGQTKQKTQNKWNCKRTICGSMESNLNLLLVHTLWTWSVRLFVQQTRSISIGRKCDVCVE